MTTMQAARLLEPQRFEIGSVAVPTPGRDEVLIQVDACGVCMSDFYPWSGYGKSYPFGFGAPGHEVCGTIAAVGDEVSGLAPGRRVTAITFPGRGYAEYALAQAALTVALEEEHGAGVVLGEPLACAVNAMRRSTVRPGDSVLVLGAGYMGGLALQVLANMGAAPLIAADIRPSSRALATRLGADIVLDSAAADFQDQILALTDGKGAAVVIEATGAQSALDCAQMAIAIKGTLVIYGYHVGAPRTIDMQQWNWKGLNVVNGHERDPFVYAQGMRYGLQLLKYGKIANELITHSFPLAAINDAFAALKAKPDGYIKAVVRP